MRKSVFRNWRTKSLSLAILAVLLFVLPFAQHVQAQPVVNLINLPAGSVPVGIAFSPVNHLLYYASYTNGFIMKVNTTASTYTNLTQNTGSFNRNYYGITLDQNNNLWLTRRGVGNNNNPAGVSLINTVTGKETELLNSTAGEWDGITYSSGYVYVANGTTLYKISTTAPYPMTTFPITGAGFYYGTTADSLGNIWFSDIIGGSVDRFNVTSGLVTYYPGFNRPLGIGVISSTVYVAENCDGIICAPAIAAMSVTGGPITRTSVTGSPYALLTSGTSVLWSSDGEDAANTKTICVLGGTCVNTNEFNFYLATNGIGNVYFSYFGSSGVGQVAGLLAQSPQDSIGSVLQTLKTLRTSSIYRPDQLRLSIAIGALMVSLDSQAWVGSSHLNTTFGGATFAGGAIAVNMLTAMLKDSLSSVSKPMLRGLVDQLVSSERSLATIALNDAINAHGNAAKIALARGALAQGDRYAANHNADRTVNHFTQAIVYYGLTWHYAEQAVGN